MNYYDIFIFARVQITDIPRKCCVNSNPTLRKIPKFPGVENLWKRTVSAEFWEKSLKTLQNCAISKNFHTR